MRGLTFWFTGLSGAGKSTIAEAVRRQLESEGRRISIIDGDDVRGLLHKHLGFSEPDIKENNKLISELCLARRADTDAILVPIISPFRASRAAARKLLAPRFFEIYIKASVPAVTARDVKGLYAKAKAGEIAGMIGVSPTAAPYEPPESADLVIATDVTTAFQAISTVTQFVRDRLDDASAEY